MKGSAIVQSAHMGSMTTTTEQPVEAEERQLASIETVDSCEG